MGVDHVQVVILSYPVNYRHTYWWAVSPCLLHLCSPCQLVTKYGVCSDLGVCYDYYRVDRHLPLVDANGKSEPDEEGGAVVDRCEDHRDRVNWDRCHYDFRSNHGLDANDQVDRVETDDHRLQMNLYPNLWNLWKKLNVFLVRWCLGVILQL